MLKKIAILILCVYSIISLVLLVADGNIAREQFHDSPIASVAEGVQTLAATEEEYGNKYLNLLRLHALTQGIEGVEVPLPQGIASSDSHRFIDSTAPEVSEIWNQLGQLFREYSKTETQDSWPAFLEKPEVVDLLNNMNQDIEAAYQAAASNPTQYGLLGLTPEILQWLNQIQEKGHYLMVRSSGAEDTKKLANAGGNLSVAYVSPTPHDVAIAVGRVIASYYSLSSLKNRLISGDNPFIGNQRLAVTIMELVGEPVGGVQEDRSIPISLVLFTNEPLYTHGGFRIMRISSTFGHGEAVVNNMGIGSDTFLLVDSKRHPDGFYVVSQINPKTERLVPIQDEKGGISLQKRPSPPDRVDSATFDRAMLQRLYALGIAVEKAYGYPMDMELVVKDGTIFPVQARPVNRPEIAPTFLDRQQLNRVPSSMSSSKTGKVVVVGTAQVEILMSAEQILRAATLEKAQENYKKGKHKVVIINHDEPANSHPVVNFSSWGVPVLFFPDSDHIDALIQHASDKTPVVVDSQSGLLGVWNSDVAPIEGFIKPGYVIHPANLSPRLDVSKILAMKRAFYTQISPDIEQAVQEIRDVCFSQDKGSSLRHLELLTSLKEKAIPFTQTYFTQLAGQRVQKSFDLVDLLQHSIDEAIDEWQQSLSLPDPEGLRCRFYAKVIEKTLVDWLPLAKEELDNVQRMSHYQSRFLQLPLFAEEAGYQNATWDKRSQEAWLAFLTSIEHAVAKLPAHVIPPVDIQRFQQTLRKYDELGILSKWMFLVFSPTYLKEAPADSSGEQDPKKVREMFQRLLAELKPEVEEQLKLLQTQNQRLLAIHAQLEQFDDPRSFNRAWVTLQEAVAPFLAETDGGQYLESLKTAPVVTRLVASDVMANVVDIVDSAIKRMLTSASFSDEQKVDHLAFMLKADLALLRAWSSQLITPPIYAQDKVLKEVMTPEQYNSYVLANYLIHLQKGLESTGNSASELHPTPGFDVSTVMMENLSVKTEEFPVNKEGYFTLIHQNLLSVLQRYIADILPHDVVLPTLFEGLQEMLQTLHATQTPSRVGINGPLLTIAYNIPLRDHSAVLKVIYDKRSETAEIEIRFFGVNEIGRWVILAEYAKLFASEERVTLSRPPEHSSNGVSLILLAENPDQATAIFKAFTVMRDITFKIAFPYDPSWLWKDVDTILATRFTFKYLPTAKRTAVMNELYVRALLYGKIAEDDLGSVMTLLDSKGLQFVFIDALADWLKVAPPEEQELALDKLVAFSAAPSLPIYRLPPSFIAKLILQDTVLDSRQLWNGPLLQHLLATDKTSDVVLPDLLMRVGKDQTRAEKLVSAALSVRSSSWLLDVLENKIQSSSHDERLGAAQTAIVLVESSHLDDLIDFSGLFRLGEIAAQDSDPSIRKLGEQLLLILQQRNIPTSDLIR